MYKLYAKTDEKGIVVATWCDAFEPVPDETYVAVATYDKEYDIADHLDRMLVDMDGHYNYKVNLPAGQRQGPLGGKVENGEMVERTAQEKALDAKPKTELEQMRETLDMVLLSMLGGDGNV